MLREANITGDAFTEQMPACPPALDAGRSSQLLCGGGGGRRGKNLSQSYWRSDQQSTVSFSPGLYPEFSAFVTGNARNHFAKRLESAGFQGKWRLTPYGEGMGAIGLPGDVSPVSRFVRASFLKWNSVCGEDAEAEISQFFHILDGVSMVRGSVQTEEGKYETTIYTCCIRPREGIYYYKTYDDSQICGVDLFQEDINGRTLSVYEVKRRQQVIWQNGGNKRNEG